VESAQDLRNLLVSVTTQLPVSTTNCGQREAKVDVYILAAKQLPSSPVVLRLRPCHSYLSRRYHPVSVKAGQSDGMCITWALLYGVHTVSSPYASFARHTAAAGPYRFMDLRYGTLALLLILFKKIR